MTCPKYGGDEGDRPPGNCTVSDLANTARLAAAASILVNDTDRVANPAAANLELSEDDLEKLRAWEARENCEA